MQVSYKIPQSWIARANRLARARKETRTNVLRSATEKGLDVLERETPRPGVEVKS